jgi:uncharacterized membrane protein YuzA (DUF378 family)
MATTTTANRTTSLDHTAASRLNALDWISLVLMIIGGINWGLVGAFQFDLVAAIFGNMTTLSRIVYVLVGLAALYGIALLIRLAKR